MANVSSAIPNLINGVSQQPDAMRLSSQGELQENAYPSIVEGLKQRGGSYHVAKLTSSLLDGAHVHTIRRDSSEKYKLILTNGGIQVYDMDGTAKTVATPNGVSYLAASDPSKNFSCMTIADYTFVVNKTKTVGMAASTSTSQGPRALAFVKTATSYTQFTIEIDSYKWVLQLNNAAANGWDQGNVTSDIMKALQGLATSYTTLVYPASPTALPTPYTFNSAETTLQFWRTDGADFTFKAYDSRSGTCMDSFKGQTQRFSELPTVAPDGFVMEIVGDNTSNFDNYFVKFTPDSGSFGKGVWKETVKPGIQYLFDANTMPHILVRESDGTFTFKQATWAERKVGDTDTAKEPTFVSRAINACFFYRNRLGFLSDENAVMSAATEFFRFWPSTVTTLVDSDPIDIPAGSSRVAILNHAVPFGEDLVLFSDLDQFVLEFGDVLSPKTADLKPITAFESSGTVTPVNTGKNVLFAVDRGEWAGVQEYYIDNDSGNRDAVDVTSHVPKYIPGPIQGMSVSANENVMACLATDPYTVYLYKYFWSGNDKLQSAWGRWLFSGKVLDAEFSETDLHLVIQRSDGTYLERISVQAGYAEPGAPFEFHLDRKVTEADCSVVYDSGANTTTWTLPYNIDSTMMVVTRYLESGTPVHNPGESLRIISSGTNTVTVSGNYADAEVIIGEVFTFRYRFSQQAVKEAVDSGGKAVVGLGRLMMRHWMVLYDETGYFQVNVTPLYRDTSTYIFTGRILGSGNNILGVVPLESGKFKFPVKAKNYEVLVEITSDSYLPCRFISAEWEANFIIRSRRV